jgi:hypothetical protein
MKPQDIWFLLLISVIVAYLQLVGDICNFEKGLLLPKNSS